MIEAGMSVARINFSHSPGSAAEDLFLSVRAAAADAGVEIAILADLAGPKVRLGALPGGELMLVAGELVTLNGKEDGALGTTYERLGSDLEPDDRILLADGAAELRVLEAGESVRARVVVGGKVRSGAGVNIPAERLSLPCIGPRDRSDLATALELGADYVAQSFVRSSGDVEEMAALIEGRAGLVAKIETRSAVDDFDKILQFVDAVMVARGDLGVELPFEEIPLIQKDLILRSLNHGVPTIVATQMLESMTSAPRPTRAEASDVANAVIDGADSIMLSAETAIGSFPVEAAKAAVRIAAVADSRGNPARPAPRLRRGESEDRAMAQAATSLAQNGVVDAIACFTRSGATARLISAVRPEVPIYAFSPDVQVLRRLALFRSVLPRAYALPQELDSLAKTMESRLRDEEGVQVGSSVLMIGSIEGGEGQIDFFKIHRIH